MGVGRLVSTKNWSFSGSMFIYHRVTTINPPFFTPFPVSFEPSRDFLEDKAVSTSTTLSPFEVKRLSVMAIKLFTKAWRLAMKTWEENGGFHGKGSCYKWMIGSSWGIFIGYMGMIRISWKMFMEL